MSKTYLLIGEEQRGPYSEDELREQFAAGTITADTLCWREGMAEWQALGTMETTGNKLRPPVTTIAPPRRTRQTEPRAYSLVDPQEKALKGQNLSVRVKPITLYKALGIFVLFLVIVSALLEILTLSMPDLNKQFKERVGISSH